MTNIDPILDGFSDAELTAALADRKRRRDERLAENLRRTPPRWKYTLRLNDDPYYTGKVWDETIEVWKLTGECINKDDALAAGHSESDVGDRSHSYIFNRETGRFVMAEGGGYILASCRQAFTEMEWLINGQSDGDTVLIVTSIIDDHFQCGRGIGGFGKQADCKLFVA